jgi:hypothetical protein
VESFAAIVVRADQVELAQDESESDPVYGRRPGGLRYPRTQVAAESAH